MTKEWLDFIPVGHKNAIKQKPLAQSIGVTPETLKGMIRDVRLNGFFVCSCPDGYYLPENENEKKAFIGLMRKQAESRLNILKALEEQEE